MSYLSCSSSVSLHRNRQSRRQNPAHLPALPLSQGGPTCPGAGALSCLWVPAWLLLVGLLKGHSISPRHRGGSCAKQDLLTEVSDALPVPKRASFSQKQWSHPARAGITPLCKGGKQTVLKYFPQDHHQTWIYECPTHSAMEGHLLVFSIWFCGTWSCICFAVWCLRGAMLHHHHDPTEAWPLWMFAHLKYRFLRWFVFCSKSENVCWSQIRTMSPVSPSEIWKLIQPWVTREKTNLKITSLKILPLLIGREKKKPSKMPKDNNFELLNAISFSENISAKK